MLTEEMHHLKLKKLGNFDYSNISQKSWYRSKQAGKVWTAGRPLQHLNSSTVNVCFYKRSTDKKWISNFVRSDYRTVLVYF